MALRSDFEGLKSLILSRSSLSFVDLVVSKLLVEEIHLKSHSEKGILSTPNPSILTIPSESPSNN